MMKIGENVQGREKNNLFLVFICLKLSVCFDYPTEKTEANNDSDDEMDYGAELERLMGDDAPPVKKRFMRMHADDEEEKIQAKRQGFL